MIARKRGWSRERLLFVEWFDTSWGVITLHTSRLCTNGRFEIRGPWVPMNLFCPLSSGGNYHRGWQSILGVLFPWTNHQMVSKLSPREGVINGWSRVVGHYSALLYPTLL